MSRHRRPAHPLARPLAVGAALLLAAALPGCGRLGGPALVSAQSPAGTGSVNDNSEPQPIGSLPPGAATSSPNIPTSYQPNDLSVTFGGRH